MGGFSGGRAFVREIMLRLSNCRLGVFAMIFSSSLIARNIDDDSASLNLWCGNILKQKLNTVLLKPLVFNEDL